MSKIRTILTTGVLTLGMLGGSSPTAMAATGVDRLQENVNDEFFMMSRIDTKAGLVRLRLVVPDGHTLERIVIARPSEDRYRLMSELDAAAMKILDGGAEGLELVEADDPEEYIFNGTYRQWVGFDFYDYKETGLRFLDRNPADVMYIGTVLKNTKTGKEVRYFHKANYRNCAHEEIVIKGEMSMCEATHEGERTYFMPETMELVSDAPTWEAELLTLAKSVTQEYFDELERLEVVKKEGGKVEQEQIEVLEANKEEIAASLTKFPELTEIGALETDYASRVEALKQTEGTGSGGSTDDTETAVTTPSVTQPGGAQIGGTTGDTTEVVIGNDVLGDGSGVTPEVVKAPVLNRVTTEVASGVVNEAMEPEIAGTEVTASETEIEREDDQEEMAVPKLGGSWLERYWLAMLIAGASATGVAGWFLIGVLGKKRKRNER